VYGLSERADAARAENLLPFGFAYSGRLRGPVKRDQPLTWADVEVDESSELYRMRQEQDRIFGKRPSG
jgi:predicted homoserine dehydrogenase-like protein